jgi:hypothetical protein
MGIGEITVLVGLSLCFFVGLFGSILVIASVMTKKLVAKIEQEEGVVRKAPRAGMTFRLNHWRSRGRIAHGKITKTWGDLLLTQRGLIAIAGTLRVRIDNDVMPEAEAWVEDGKLIVKTEKPSEATGEAQVSITLADAQDWLKVLGERGFRMR